ncbi:diguanylate cyclase domain-containing protein [Desulfurivibrio alkaliphilus]|uniref:diguanylate cyclase n=1 Tax=Desulfurivibrio alkaliphilus (strain DSM 19089 / UNIQEM U267 / AHT2) TaxID=589865 RepID=D6Z3A0_DESAT|nr:diguanylate cyclase [Desulfurivibrio alkaliphilus]ADH86025.1 response regulator receiver modulated diguanylate cyclase [Desulfurivibrio alkaliphilus AHT 2]
MPGIPKILIVDDQPANLLVMEGLLEGMEAQLVTATSGEQALSLLLEHDFALLLLDVQMPGMDGFETASLLRGRKQTRHLPIIFVTAISKEDKHVFKAYEAGAVDYLFKPINAHILRSKVEIFLQLDRQQRLLAQKSAELDRKVRELLGVKSQLEEANARLNELSLTDALTGLANRRCFQETIHTEWRRAMRNRHPLTLVLGDIDSFKQFNDNFGHLVGDECLVRIAAVIRSPLMRPSDLAARFGGEEFVILLPETDLEGGRHLAETVRQEVEKMSVEHPESGTRLQLTMSFGVSSVVPQPEFSEQDLICAADKALYVAKEGGRNRVQVQGPRAFVKS